MRQNKYSLKMNGFLYLKAEKAENFSVELNLVERFLIYAIVHKLSSFIFSEFV